MELAFYIASTIAFSAALLVSLMRRENIDYYKISVMYLMVSFTFGFIYLIFSSVFGWDEKILWFFLLNFLGCFWIYGFNPYGIKGGDEYGIYAWAVIVLIPVFYFSFKGEVIVPQIIEVLGKENFFSMGLPLFIASCMVNVFLVAYTVWRLRLKLNKKRMRDG